MELQGFINNNNDYLTEFKKNGLYVRKYSNRGLCIVKMHYNKEYDIENNPWLKYCRGVVIDIKTNKIVCLPPEKASEINVINNTENIPLDIKENINDFQKVIDEYDESFEYQPLFDGTMVNMFYHNDEWLISTRSNIGGKNSWDGKRSFLDMFLEIHGVDWFNNLNKKYCYSFLMHHVNNRNVSPIEQNMIFLIENYEIKDDVIIKQPLVDIDEKIVTNFQLAKEMLNGYQTELSFGVKGLTIKTGNKRINWLNPKFLYVKTLKMNYNHKFLNYIMLKQRRLLTEYLNYFPEDRFLFDEYRQEYNIIKQKLYDSYVSRYILKEIENKDIAYPLKPLIYEIHGFYLKTKQKITMKIISDYLHQFDGKKILFIRNYLF